jgi:hypothetical protein
MRSESPDSSSSDSIDNRRKFQEIYERQLKKKQALELKKQEKEKERQRD